MSHNPPPAEHYTLPTGQRVPVMRFMWQDGQHIVVMGATPDELQTPPVFPGYRVQVMGTLSEMAGAFQVAIVATLINEGWNRHRHPNPLILLLLHN